MCAVRSNLVLVIAVACCLAPAAVDVAPALAQLDRGTRLRALDAFDAYDLDGPETLEAIALLSEQIRDGQVVVGAPRLAHARAATDLWLLSRLDPERAHLEQDLAEALGVPSFAIVGALREGLDAVDDPELAGRAGELAEAIELAQAIESREPVSLTGVQGLRRDALLVRVVGRAIEDGDDAELEAWYDDPCVDEAGCDAPWAGWAPSSRSIVAALVDASDALARLDEAWSDGDPFARAVVPALAGDARRLDLHVHAPALAVPESLGLAAAPSDEGLPARVDLLVVAGPDRVRVVAPEPVGIREGRLVEIDASEAVGAPGASEATIDVPVPRAPGEDPPVLAAVVERLRAIELAPGAVVAVGVDDEVSAARLGRVLASMVQAQRAPTAVARRASDRTLRIAPIRVIDESAVGAPGDVVLDAAAPDPEILAGGAAPGRRVVVRAGPDARARGVIDTAFDAAEGGDLVALVGQ